MGEFQENRRFHSNHDVARTGVLLGLMMVLVLMGIFFPIIGGLALLIQPSILYLIAERSGLKTAVLSTAGVILLTVFLIGPFEALKASFLDILPSLVFVILFIVGTKRFKDKILSVKYLYLNIPKFNPKNKKIRMKMPSKIP